MESGQDERSPSTALLFICFVPGSAGILHCFSLRGMTTAEGREGRAAVYPPDCAPSPQPNTPHGMLVAHLQTYLLRGVMCLGGRAAVVAAVGVVVAGAADIGEEEEEMGRVLLVVREERPPLLLLAIPAGLDGEEKPEDTSRVQARPMALAAMPVLLCKCVCAVGGRE